MADAATDTTSPAKPAPAQARAGGSVTLAEIEMQIQREIQRCELWEPVRTGLFARELEIWRGAQRLLEIVRSDQPILDRLKQRAKR